MQHGLGYRDTLQDRTAASLDLMRLALDRDAPHLALAAAREAARAALLALGQAPVRTANTELALLREMAAASPQHLAGRPAERQAVLRATLALLDRLFPLAAAAPDGGATEAIRQASDGQQRIALDDHALGRGPLADCRILLVEDDAIIAMLEEDALAEAGAEVLGPASSVGEALRLIEQAVGTGGLGGAVLDLALDGNGVAPVADRLAALGVPFLFATGSVLENALMRRHQAAPVLCKPFDPRELLAAVSALTRSH